ncbi:MAG: oligoribonuclease [Myxococcota bacterium]|nr:oligoribonuclease [Myxococcota bacterium]
MDMEMSGLAVERERILEVAIIVTDGQLQVIAEGPEIVVHQPDAVLDAMDDWNKTHHGASGLISRVRASTIDEAQAEAMLLELVAAHVGPRGAPLAGNSIHQDRLFLAKYMPQLHEHLHYRNVDVSTLKELVRRWHPAAYAARPTKRGSHRALDDIRESIEELRYYRNAVFVPTA